MHKPTIPDIRESISLLIAGLGNLEPSQDKDELKAMIGDLGGLQRAAQAAESNLRNHMRSRYREATQAHTELLATITDLRLHGIPGERHQIVDSLKRSESAYQQKHKALRDAGLSDAQIDAVLPPHPAAGA
jgi:hypothetical protein